MAQWPTNPDWTPVDLINGGVEISTADGFLASDQNKIVENMIYLFNHLSSQHVYVGNVTTTTGAEGTQAKVKITGRYVDGTGDGDPELYLDFEFTIPEGVSAKFDTPTGSATKLDYTAQPTITITATGPNDNKKFNFSFGIPEGTPAGFDTPTAVANTLQPGSPATAAVAASGTNQTKKFAFTFGIPQGKTGEVGPPGPSVAAGMSPQVVNEENWSGASAPYTLTIPASQHGLGETPNLVVITLPGSRTDGYEETYDSPSVSADGTVTIQSNVKWTGNVLICGGIAEAVDVTARQGVEQINEKIPTQATAQNQLADKAFVNSSIANNAANFVTPSASSEDTMWGSFSALQAGPWYHNGQPYTPTKNDYAVYINTDNSQWRAHYTGTVWQAQYEVNDTPFTAAQNAAINSGATAANITAANNHVASRSNPHGVTTDQIGAAKATDLSAHTNNTSNPHKVTKAQVGLGNVDNTADSAKPVSSAQATAIADAKKAGTDAQANLTAHEADTENPHSVTKTQVGLSAVANERQYSAQNPPPYPVTSVAGKTGAVTLVKGDVGLGNVDNTADSAKPVSTAQKAAIDAVQSNLDDHEADKANPHGVTKAQVGLGNVDNVKQYSASNPPPYPVTSVAGKTGAVTLTKSDVGLANVDNTADANKSVAMAQKWKGVDTRSTNENPSYYMSSNSMTGWFEFKQVAAIGAASVLQGTYCWLRTFTPWGDSSGGYPVQIATQNDSSGLPRMAMRCGTSTTAWSAWKLIATVDQIPSIPVTSVNGKTGAVTVTKADVGLGNCDNTSDANKPVSTAQATAIADAKKAGTDAQANLNTHTANKSNPHSVTASQVGLGNVKNVDQTNAANITAGELNKLRIGAGLIIAGDNIIVSRNASTGVYTITANIGTVAPYEVDIPATTSGWSGSAGNYYKTITAATHGKGTRPQVETWTLVSGTNYEQTYDSPQVNMSNGDVTVYSNALVAMKVIIR